MYLGLNDLGYNTRRSETSHRGKAATLLYSAKGCEMKRAQPAQRDVAALKVEQWLAEWEKVPFSPKSHRRKPEPHFYLFTLPASWLKELSGIYRRTTQGGLLRSEDLGIQRRHDERRSDEIREFIQFGYPWSELSKAKRQSGKFDDLRKPGWLPTAIVVNVLRAGDKRRGLEVASKDLVEVEEDSSAATIRLPERFSSPGWKPQSLHPIEVIDGQHRLWAFEKNGLSEGFQLPIVAFHGLDISWQAYLFWTINIKPKRINASLAFDLYPLLRTEDWLEKFEGHSIYRETRAQELTEALWAIEESPWYQRINMLGESGQKEPMVSQAAWIRSLMATFVKSWEGRGIAIGGLFGAPVGKHDEVLPWGRAQQAAFLIFMGQCLRDAIANSKENWAKSLRRAAGQVDKERDPAFYGPHTLLNTDQGIRGLLYITNDLCYLRSEDLKLDAWRIAEEAGAADQAAVRAALTSLRKQEVAPFVKEIASGLAAYDWRTSAAPDLEDLSEVDRIRKAALRGSGGYKELRQDLLRQLAGEGKAVGKAAKLALVDLGYE
jgi:DGQHR domain-containing protein